MVYKNIIINPDKYLLPSYKLSPFSLNDIHLNKNLPDNSSCDDFFNEHFAPSYFYYTENGRQALNLALKKLTLKDDDIVSIITTSQNFYISGCVTAEIEKFCKWNREICDKTKVIFINHEFGFPYKDVEKLKQKGLPIIEDCAHSFANSLYDKIIGKTGDFTIYSFPKFFPIQIGGLLVSKQKLSANAGDFISVIDQKYIQKVIGRYIKNIPEFIGQRNSNYQYLAEKTQLLGCSPRFELDAKSIPGAFMFRLPDQVDAVDLKEFFYANGVECSVFYKENTFFIPCHQNLTKDDLDYFLLLLDYYINFRENENI